MNITLGSLVLCKILVLSPISKDIPRDDGLITYGAPEVSSSTNMTAMRLVRGNDGQQNNQNTQDNKNPNYSYVEKVVTGVVEEIKSRRRLVEIDKNKQYEYKDFHTLLVRTDELEKLLVQSESCALADSMIKDNQKKTEPIEPEVKKEVSKKVPPKAQEKKEAIKLNENEVVLDEYEEVLDEETLKLYSNYIDEHKRKYHEGDNSIRMVDVQNESLKKVEERGSVEKIEYTDEDLKRIAQQVLDMNDVKKEESKEVAEVPVKVEKEVVNNVKEIKDSLPSKDLSLFDFFEEEKRKEKKEEKKAEKKVAVVEKKKEPVQDISRNYDKKPNLFIEAFKIILFE